MSKASYLALISSLAALASLCALRLRLPPNIPDSKLAPAWIAINSVPVIFIVYLYYNYTFYSLFTTFINL